MNADGELGVNTGQAAEYLGVNKSTMRRWSDAGHIACYRTPGGQRRFRKADLDDFVARRRQDRDDRERASERP